MGHTNFTSQDQTQQSLFHDFSKMSFRFDKLWHSNDFKKSFSVFNLFWEPRIWSPLDIIYSTKLEKTEGLTLYSQHSIFYDAFNKEDCKAIDGVTKVPLEINNFDLNFLLWTGDGDF